MAGGVPAVLLANHGVLVFHRTAELASLVGGVVEEAAQAGVNAAADRAADGEPRSRRDTHEGGSRRTDVTAARAGHIRVSRNVYSGMDDSRPDMRSSERDWLADQFQAWRPHLHALAYRMLGSLGDADDAIQETWLRLDRSDTSAISDLRNWLSTVAGRVCLDMLRSRKASREHYSGTWLPEPLARAEPTEGPEQQAILADFVGMALLVVLKALTPAERLAFVLHDIFDVPFDQIAPVVDRTPQRAHCSAPARIPSPS